MKFSIGEVFKDIDVSQLKLARRLMVHILQKNEAYIIGHPEELLSSEQYHQFQEFYQRLVNAEPMSRILGKREFWGMDFSLNEETLDPRADSETLVEVVVSYCKKAHLIAPRILDLGTGTGCLIVSILKELSEATGMAVDISQKALACAQENARRHNVENRIEFQQSDWFQNVKEKFDIIISNPPYISEDEYKDLDTNVRNFDPMRALVSGPNGLEAYSHILLSIENYMCEHARVFFEIGASQGGALENLLKRKGFVVEGLFQDYSQHDRVIQFCM